MAINDSVVMPFGKFRGKTFAQISKSDKGLLYLDWLIGQDWLTEPFRSQLAAFVTDPHIKLHIEDVLRLSGRMEDEDA